MHWSPIILFFRVFTLVLGTKLDLPSTLSSCQSTTIPWSTAPDPSESGNPFSNLLTLSTQLSDGILFTVIFSNMSENGLTFIPIFEPGSTILAQESDFSSTAIQVEDSGQRDCLLDLSQSSSGGQAPPPAGSAVSPEPLTIVNNNQPSLNVSQCSRMSVEWSGGVPPYHAVIANNTQSESTLELLLTNVTGTSLSITWPLQANNELAYQLVILDSSQNTQNASIEMFITDTPGTTLSSNCLLEAVSSPASPPEQTSSPVPSGSASSSSTSHGKTIVAIVVPVVVVVTLIPIVLFGIRHFRRKRLLQKTQEFKDRLDANAIRLDNVKNPLSSQAKEI